MPTTAMSQNQEVIEAKLCAYIDGELDLEGRTEIERHLEANPQHRRLLESLKATKDLVRWLPREPAPPEVAETLNGQLERSVLLDYDGDSLRPSPLPRILAAAAIVALTVGLAAAVYFALPKSQKNATPYAFHPAEGAATMATATAAAGPGQAEVDNPEVSAPAPSEPALTESNASNRPAAQAAIAPPPDQSTDDLDRLAQDVARNRDAYVAAAASGNPPPHSVAGAGMVLLVHSDSPLEMQQRLTTYLEARKIQWKPAGAGAELSVDQNAGEAAHAEPAPPQALGPGASDAWFSVDPQSRPTTQPALALEPAAGAYVARMSPRQAQELNLTFLHQQLTPSASTIPAEPQVAAISPDSVGAPLAAESAPPLAPTTAPASQPAPAQPALAEAAKANAVSLAHDNPAGSRVESARQTSPATRPAIEPAAQVPPTTAPASPAVNVVILVQTNVPGVSPAAPPATQPAAASPGAVPTASPAVGSPAAAPDTRPAGTIPPG